MSSDEDVQWGARVLPGVDLALWLRIIVAAVLALAAAVVAVTVR
ncbi:MAG TPA: hypothetical protein VG708_03855 [Mycobacteriales bacterium]|nr:hypothetical protein [Mycobacteriales bacterium]